MWTSTVAVAAALPGQPAMVTGDSTVVRSGICTSVLLVTPQPVGAGVGAGGGLGVGVGVGLGVGVGVGLGAGVGVGVAAVATPQSGSANASPASLGGVVRAPVPSLAITSTAPPRICPHGWPAGQ